MPDWITMQETADKIGIRKGTLCMWRNRNKFPFKTQGTGRSLKVSTASLDEWMEKNKDQILKGRNKPRKPMKKKTAKTAKKTVGRPAKKKKVGRPAKKAVGRPPKKGPGRPAKKRPGRPKKKVGRPAKKAGRPAKKAGRPPMARTAAAKGTCEIMVQGDLDLNVIQDFVDNLRAGHKLQIAPTSRGYLLTTVPV